MNYWSPGRTYMWYQSVSVNSLWMSLYRLKSLVEDKLHQHADPMTTKMSVYKLLPKCIWTCVVHVKWSTPTLVSNAGSNDVLHDQNTSSRLIWHSSANTSGLMTSRLYSPSLFQGKFICIVFVSVNGFVCRTRGAMIQLQSDLVICKSIVCCQGQHINNCVNVTYMFVMPRKARNILAIGISLASVEA
jgi:hypothetical protein